MSAIAELAEDRIVEGVYAVARKRRLRSRSGSDYLALELRPGPTFQPTAEGRLLGHVHLGLRLIEERATPLETEVRTELLHAVATHHDSRAARTAEASCLYHANHLDAVAATRPVETAGDR